MTLKIDSKEDDKRQLHITVEVAEGRVQKHIEKVVKKASHDIRVPGFRPGKAPLQMLRQFINMAAVREDAINEMMPEVYQEVISGFISTIYSNPVITDLVHEPSLSFTILAPLTPTVDLGEYYSYRKEIQVAPISEEQVQQFFLSARQKLATTQEVDRPAQLGDTLLIRGSGNMVADKEDVIYEEKEPVQLLLDEAYSPFEDTPFIQKLVGAKSGDTIEFSFVFPDGYNEVNQEAEFHIDVDKVFELLLPELNDELAPLIAPNYSTIADIRTAIVESMEKEAFQKLKNDVVEQFIDELVDNLEELVYSPLLISREVDGMINQLKEHIKKEGLDWDEFLESKDITGEELFEDYEEKAVSRVERGLVFDKFIRQEKIRISEEERRNEIGRRVATMPEAIQAQYQQYLLSEQGSTELAVSLITEKVYERILQIYAGEVTQAPAEALPTEEPLSADPQEPESDSEA